MQGSEHGGGKRRLIRSKTVAKTRQGAPSSKKRLFLVSSTAMQGFNDVAGLGYAISTRRCLIWVRQSHLRFLVSRPTV